jgi:hypothetical protein
MQTHINYPVPLPDLTTTSNRPTKCSTDYCANNCGKCQKYVTAFLRPVPLKCACYIEKKFGRIIEEQEDVEENEGVLVVFEKTVLESKKDTLLRSCSSSSTLDTISEERLY